MMTLQRIIVKPGLPAISPILFPGRFHFTDPPTDCSAIDYPRRAVPAHQPARSCRRGDFGLILLAGVLWWTYAVWALPAQADDQAPLQRAKVFLQAADYRRAIEACQEEVRIHPSAAAYVYLTYVYLALDQYLDHLAKTDQWVTVELIYLNLASGKTEDLTDPPDVLARIAKEVVQQALQRQADITAAMAKRLDEAAARELWKQQTAWRQAKPTDWWFGVPPEWSW